MALVDNRTPPFSVKLDLKTQYYRSRIIRQVYRKIGFKASPISGGLFSSQEIYQSWVDMPRQKNEQVGQDQTIAKLAAACEMSTLRGSKARQGSPCLTAGEDVNFNIYRISYYCFSYNRHSALLNIKLISFIYLSP